VKPNALVPESPRTYESIISTNDETKVASKASQQEPQQSAVADARSKFEQVLQASKQAAAAGSPSVNTYNDKKQLTTDDAVAASRCRNPDNELMSSLLYSQLVCTLFTV